MATERALPVLAAGIPLALRNALAMWADATTDATTGRRRDLLRDKTTALGDFFAFVGKAPAAVTPLDVKAWQADLEARGLSPASVYARVSRVSSWYKWAAREPELGIRGNPCNLARPKAPKPYQSESTQSLTDEEMAALLAHVKAKAAAGDVVGKRDYAMLLLYTATGMRRQEVAGLTWGHVKVNGKLTITGTVKGGDYESRDVADPRVRDALLDYLASSGRLQWMQPTSPLWTRHDRGGKPGKALGSHAFVKNLKAYAEAAGIGPMHLHQTRHTAARIWGDESGSMTEVQTLLGHKNVTTTRVYLQRIGTKQDRYSTRILDRLGV